MENDKKCGCGCSSNASNSAVGTPGFVCGWQDANGEKIQRVSSKLDFNDIIGALKVRLALGRDDYKVEPGLYCIGRPGSDSPVLVTANYKLTFDILRKETDGLSAWILALDTKGVNVWCAAGKGTFGTEELIRKISAVNLSKIVDHKKIILPQLGAVGVAAHLVKEATGFNVHYGPVRAADIKKYISDGYKKDDEMRRVTFNLRDRLTVIPVELVMAWKFIAGIAAFFLFLKAFRGKFLWKKVARDLVPSIGGIFAGVVATPAFLPYIPGRAFSVKGFISGVCWLALSGFNFGFTVREWIANFFMIAPLSSFFALNFTGATTFTSQSGAEYEVKKTFKLMKYSFILGIVLKILSKFKK
ncbi:MAG TPA: mercury methylation corrinoid protein HgcA [Candidatus Wallbacteria bacterium]|nr:mercury methylation corrinoid protein HgcA [Candidatus Wallbacteria bacterium]